MESDDESKNDVLSSAIIISFAKSSASDIAKDILQHVGNEEEILPVVSDEYLQTFIWHIDTKYYTAEVELCAIQKDLPVTSVMSEKLTAMEALIVQFENQSRQTFDEAKSLVTVLTDYEPSVKLLVCDNCSHDCSVVTKIEAQEWCIKNGFELIELNEDESSDSEDDFPETTGIKRIIQALHAHQWPNLNLKEKPSSTAPAFGNLLSSTTKPHTTTELEAAMNDVALDEKLGDRTSTSLPFEPEADVLAALENHDTETESFEALFNKFQEMKDKAQQLSPSKRKQYAERVAIAFWKAIGGDDEEIAGLEDDLDE